jgi:hypothetical protein
LGQRTGHRRFTVLSPSDPEPFMRLTALAAGTMLAACSEPDAVAKP